jgi:hypothetical protein
MPSCLGYTVSGYAFLATFVVMFVHEPDAIATWYIAKMCVYPGKQASTRPNMA